jgi:hypothetical protein
LHTNLPIHDLIAKHLRTEKVFVVDVAEEAEAKVASVTLPEFNFRNKELVQRSL